MLSAKAYRLCAAGMWLTLGCSGTPEISPSSTGGATQGTGGQFAGSSGTGGSQAAGSGGIGNGGSQAAGSGGIGNGGSATGGVSTGGTTSTGTGATGGALNESWDFATDAEGWIGGFADYPPSDAVTYDLQFGWAALPTEVGPGGGLRVNGNNHSDDLFSYIKREVTGLIPDTTYLLDVTVVIDTNASSECGGIGGAPGGSVYFKIGATSVEPTASLDSQAYLRMNIDKGNQSTGGADMKVVGNIGNTLPCVSGPAAYEPKTLTLTGFSAMSAADGTLWLIVGTDSGFEGITTLFYDRIAVTLEPGNN